MSEVKHNKQNNDQNDKQNCSIESPCNDDYVCDLNNNECEQNVNKLTISIGIKQNVKGTNKPEIVVKRFAGDTKTVIEKIQKIFSHVITDAKCDWGMYMVTMKDYTGEDYSKLQASLKKGKILAFFDPIRHKILCQSRYDLLQYWKEKKNTFRGVILNEREIKFLKSNSDVSARYKYNKKNEYFIPLSPLAPTIYIKQSQYQNIMTKGYSFFAVVPTNYKWIDTIQPDISAYHNYNPNRGEYGDTLYMLVPLSNSSDKQSENKVKKEIEKIYCKHRPSYVTSQPIIMKTAKELLNEFALIYKDKLSPEGEQLAKSLSHNLRSLQSLKKDLPYPYWYDLDGPMGKILRNILEKKNIQGPILSNIEFGYNMYKVQPVYIDKNTRQFLVCQNKDLDYETRLYVLIVDDGKNNIYPGYFSQNLQQLVDYAKTLNSVTFHTSLIRLNKFFMQGIREIPSLNMSQYKNIAKDINASREITKNLPIYGVAEIFKHNLTEMVICGTSLEAMKKYYNTIIENKYSIGKLLIQLKMDKPFNGDYLSQHILKKEIFDNDEEDEEEDKKEADMDLPMYITHLSQQLVEYGRQLARQYDLNNDSAIEDLIIELKDEFLSEAYQTKEEAQYKFDYFKGELDRIIGEYNEMDLSDL